MARILSHWHSYFILLLPLFISANTSSSMKDRIQKLQDIIGTDAGNRGMKSLIVPDDLFHASAIMGKHVPTKGFLVLSGFPCCVQHNPPTETDGPPGTLALARAAKALGYSPVVVVTDECNRAVFHAALQDDAFEGIQLECFSATEDASTTEDRLNQLVDQSQLLVACERAGPAQDGHCYTMRATDMTAKGLIAPLHKLVDLCKANTVPFLAIGDGGNELGMGKVLPQILNNPQIAQASTIACVIPADHLVAASVSNWGGYALAAGAALMRASQCNELPAEWVGKCLPTRVDEIALLDRCVAVGCRDGVSGKVEATVDGMPLERSLQCLEDLRAATSTQ